MKQLNEFLAALATEDPTSFVDAVENHVSRRQGWDLEELFQSTPRKDMVAICEGLHQKVELGIALFNTDPQQEPNLMEDLQDGEEDPLTLKEAGCEILIASAIVARLILVETMPSPPEALENTAALLHDNALLPASEYPALQEEVSKLCLEWWQLEGPDRGRLTPALVPYLLVAALQSGTGAAAKRCHTIRNALELFEFDDPSIGDLKRLLLRAAFAPSFLRCTDGRRFLAYLFTLQPTFVRELTAIVKNQVPAGRRSVLDAYGEIIYRAWSLATGACLLEIKEGCIQDLMEASILASTPTLAASLRRVLAGLHSQKHQPGVDAMLLELYEPILFRRLNAANPAVRRNALELFFDTFPLRDPEESSEATDARMTDQFAALSAALKDDVPAVRAAAVAGVGRILGAYWELIPGPVTAGYVKILAGQLAFDSTSSIVRAAVTEALTDLIECPMAHPLLAVVLPKLAPQLYDTSSRVRIAFVELLLSLRGVKILQWSSIFTSSKLLDVMAADIPAVSSRIQHLLLPTYFPDSKMGPSLMAALLRSHPEAGKAFCLYLVGAHMPAAGGVEAAAITSAGPSIPQHYLVTLVKDLTTHLIEVPLATEAEKEAATAAATGGKGAAAKKSRSKRKKGQNKDDEEEDAPVIETAASWESILGGLVAVSCGIAAQISQGGLDPAAAKGLFPGDTFAKILERCTTSSARAAVYNIAAALPQTPAASDVRTACVSLLGTSSTGIKGVDAGEIRAALDCVAAHPASRYALLKAMAQPFNADPEELCEGIETQIEEPPQRGKRRKFEKHAMQEISQAAAVDHLTRMLELKGPREFLVTSGVLGRILPWIDNALETRVAELSYAIEKNISQAEELAGRPEAGTAMLTYLKACVHLLLASQPGLDGPALVEGAAGDAARGQAVECLQQAMQWATQLLQRLDTIEVEDLAVALNRPAPVDLEPKPAKRSKAASKSKKTAAVDEDTTTTSVLKEPPSALKEAFSMIQASVAVAGEAARFKSLVSIGADSSCCISWAPAAAQSGQLFIQIVGKLAAAARDAPIDADMEMIEAIVLSGVSHAARLARNLAASCSRFSFSNTTADNEGGVRDLGTELANAAQEVEALPHHLAMAISEGGDFVGPLAEALMTVLCEDAYGNIITPLKPHIVGLIAAMCTAPAACKGGSGTIAVGFDGSWLAPVAALLASGIDFDEILASTQEINKAVDEETGEDDENVQPSPIGDHANNDNVGGKPMKKKIKAKDTLPIVVSEENEAPVIKQLLAATRMFQANESAAGQAAALAARAWLSQEDAALALGGIELSQLLGFQGVTLLGKSKSGANTYVTAIEKFGEVQKSLVAKPVDGGDAVPAENILLERKMKALFPPAPQMTFDEIFAS